MSVNWEVLIVSICWAATVLAYRDSSNKWRGYAIKLESEKRAKAKARAVIKMIGDENQGLTETGQRILIDAIKKGFDLQNE